MHTWEPDLIKKESLKSFLYKGSNLSRAYHLKSSVSMQSALHIQGFHHQRTEDILKENLYLC